MNGRCLYLNKIGCGSYMIKKVIVTKGTLLKTLKICVMSIYEYAKYHKQQVTTASSIRHDISTTVKP